MQFEYISKIANELQNNCTLARNDEYIAIAFYKYSNLNVTSVNPFMYMPFERIQHTCTGMSMFSLKINWLQKIESLLFGVPMSFREGG